MAKKKKSESESSSSSFTASGLSENRLNYIERMGIFFEREGLPRMAGRVFALLLTDESEVLSTSEIIRMLHASRGSVSTMTRFLLERGMIEKTGQPGQRQDFFRIKPDALNTMFSERMRIVQEFKAVIGEARGFTVPGSARHAMVLHLEAFYDWFQSRMPELWKEWEEEKKRRGLQ